MKEDYFIVCPEKCSLLNLFLSIIFPHAFKSCFIDCQEPMRSHLQENWKLKASLMIIKLSNYIARPWRAIGKFIELFLNLLWRNGGLRRTLFKILNSKCHILFSCVSTTKINHFVFSWVNILNYFL